MLTLNPGSVCDVCAEEYGSHCLPHCIPCGHVLCRTCANAIVEKTSARSSPACPFCRVHFTSADVRVIRLDFSASGYSTPKVLSSSTDNYHSGNSVMNDTWSRKTERMLFQDDYRIRTDARRLEDKVAKVAAKKSSVEEVSSLHNELQAWLTSDPKQDPQLSSLHLSAALLRAILMNHFAFSEATKSAKYTEASLKGRVDDLEIKNEKLEGELKRQRLAYSNKSQDCQNLRTELSRLKALTSMLGVTQSVAAASDARRGSSMSPPPPTSTVSPISQIPDRSPSTAPSLSRYNSTHSRTTSMHAHASILRPTTPSPPSSRPYTPAPAPPTRSYTPSIRSKTPGPSMSSSSSRTRRMSMSSQPPLPTATPPKIVRSSSEEKPDTPHERWIPSPDSASPPTSRMRYPSMSRSASISRSSSRAM